MRQLLGWLIPAVVVLVTMLQEVVSAANSRPPPGCVEGCRTSCRLVCRGANLRDLTFLLSLRRRTKPWSEFTILSAPLNTLDRGAISETDLRTVERVSIVHSRLRNVGRNALEGLDNLKELRLSGNKLIEVHNDSFESSSLEVLILDSCGIHDLPAGVLHKTANLRELKLNNNKLTEVKADLFSFTCKLEVLDFGSNALTDLSEDTLQGLGNLKVLNLTHNRITHLNERVFKHLKSLQVLDLAHNQLANLGVDLFQDLGELVVINLSHNVIRTLGEGLFHSLVNLRSLWLNHNNLTTLKKRTLEDVVENFNGSTLSLERFSVQDNPWHCGGCEMADIFQWLRTSTIQDDTFHWSQMICVTPPRFDGLSWTLLPWNDTAEDCVERRPLTEIADRHPNDQSMDQTIVHEDVANINDVEFVLTDLQGSEIRYISYFIFGGLAVAALLTALVVRHIVCKDKKQEMQYIVCEDKEQEMQYIVCKDKKQEMQYILCEDKEQEMQYIVCKDKEQEMQYKVV